MKPLSLAARYSLRVAPELVLGSVLFVSASWLHSVSPESFPHGPGYFAFCATGGVWLGRLVQLLLTDFTLRHPQCFTPGDHLAASLAWRRIAGSPPNNAGHTALTRDAPTLAEAEAAPVRRAAW